MTLINLFKKNVKFALNNGINFKIRISDKSNPTVFIELKGWYDEDEDFLKTEGSYTQMSVNIIQSNILLICKEDLKNFSIKRDNKIELLETGEVFYVDNFNFSSFDNTYYIRLKLSPDKDIIQKPQR